MFQKAVETAAKGFRIFPIKEGAPLILEWSRKATDEIEQIKTWWGVWPSANIGLVPGPSFVVLEVDIGQEGQSSYNKLRSMGVNGKTYSVSISGGGLQLYFLSPGRVNDSNDLWNSIFPGIKIYADEEFVLFPGLNPETDNPDDRYEIINEVSPVTLPQEIIEILQTAPEEENKEYPVETPKQEETSTLPEGLKAALRRYVFIGKGSLVADNRAKPNAPLLPYDEWKMFMKNTDINPDTWLRSKERITASDTTYKAINNRFIREGETVFYNRYCPPQITKRNNPAKIAPFISHIETLFGERSSSFMEWLAMTVRYPEVKVYWAPLLSSTNIGLGKTWLYYLLCKLVGEANCSRINIREDTIYPHNWEECVVVVVGGLSNIPSLFRKIKHISTKDSFCYNTLIIADEKPSPRHFSVQNHWWMVHAAKKKKFSFYYSHVYQLLEDIEAIEAFVYFLDTIDLKTFKPYQPPGSPVREDEDHADRGKRILEFMKEAFAVRSGPFAYDIVSAEVVCFYIEESLNIKNMLTHEQIHMIHDYLTGLCSEALPKQTYLVQGYSSKKRTKLHIIRNAASWRKKREEVVVDYHDRMFINIMIKS